MSRDQSAPVSGDAAGEAPPPAEGGAELHSASPAEGSGKERSATPRSAKPGKTSKTRTGTMGKTKDGKARAVANGKSKRGAVDYRELATRMDVWWLNGKGYFVRSPDERNPGFMSFGEGRMDRWLQGCGLAMGDKNKPGDVEGFKCYVEGFQRIDGVLNIAGHREGVMKMRSGEMVLVSRGPCLMPPVAGDWDWLARILEQLLVREIDGPEMPSGWRVHCKGDAEKRGREIWECLVRNVHGPDDGEAGHWVYDQRPLFYTWLKLRLELLHRRMSGDDVRRSAPVFVICGPADSYKSFLQTEVMAPLFGGRTSDPSRYLSGNTNFNGDLICAELLCMGDSPLSTSSEDRKKLGEYFKNAIAQPNQRLEMKGLDAFGAVFPVWSYVWTLNDDKNNLMQMPHMVESVVDKFIITHTNPVALAHADGTPVNTDDLDDFAEFGAAVKAQLPAFAHFLLHEWVIPPALKGGRWGMVAVQAPELMREMFEDSREGFLLDLIDAARWENATAGRQNLWQFVWSRNDTLGKFGEVKDGVWTGTHHELKALLEHEDCSVHQEVRNMFKKGARFDMALARLRKEQPYRVTRPGEDGRKHIGKQVMRLWEVRAPAGAVPVVAETEKEDEF